MPILIIFLAVGIQVWLSYKKVSPFLSLLIVAIVAGLLLGMEPSELMISIEKGAGNTLGGLALIICEGAILGNLLEKSGAISQISSTLVRKFGERHVQWAVMLTGFIIGLPLYYNAGFVILVPLIFSLAKKTNLPLVYIAIPAAASLSATHGFLPPHPGPVILAKALHADIGLTLIYGLILVAPIVIISGPGLSKLLKYNQTQPLSQHTTSESASAGQSPSMFSSIAIALLPVLLIGLGVAFENFLTGESLLKDVAIFFGNPTIALLASVLLAVVYLRVEQQQSIESIMKWLSEGITSVALILLIITSGGVLKQILIDSGTSQYITDLSQGWEINPLLFAWMTTALLRVALGSATVAGLTAAGIVAPLVTAGTVSPELMVLSVGAGSIFGSHINDTGFWMFKEYFQLSLKQTFFSWTLMETTMSVLGLIGVLILDLIL